MDPMAINITTAFSLLALVAQVFILFVVILLVFSRGTLKKVAALFTKEQWLIAAFVVAGVATFGSLYYSEVVGFLPCKMCWFQRIFLYPQFVLLGVALFRRDFHIAKYTTILSVIGLIFSFVHYYEQVSGTDLTACGATGSSCAKVYFTQFGYITFSVLAMTAFLLLIMTTHFALYRSKSSQN